jgi:galactose mutarotase-like enzyme
MRHSGARVDDRSRHGNLRAVVLENDVLRAKLVVERGCDVVELFYKPEKVDFLWHAPALSPGAGPIPASHPARPFLDHYGGGWQELFPHAGAGTRYVGAELPFHGEVWALPWEHRILRDDAAEVVVQFQVRTERLPFSLQRTVRIRSGEALLHFEETAVNEGERELEFMWGHHPAFGPPFLDEGCIVDAPARGVQVGGELHPWPVDGSGTDHSRLVPDGSSAEVMKYLCDLREGWVALTNPSRALGVGLVFDRSVFSFVWLWQELGYTRDYPWFGRAYVLGMEPQSSLPLAHDEGGRLLRLAPGSRLSTELRVVVYHASGVLRISPEGCVSPRIIE